MPSLFLLQEILWLKVLSFILDSVYMLSPCVNGVVSNLESYWEVVEPLRGSAWLGIMWLCEQGHACDQRVGFLNAGLFLFIFYLFWPSSFSFLLPFFVSIFFSALRPALSHIQSNGSSQPWFALSGTISQDKPFVLLKRFCLTKLCTMNLVIFTLLSRDPSCCNLSLS